MSVERSRSPGNVSRLRPGPPPQANRRRWCAVVAKLVSPSYPDDVALALADMLPALANFPDALFTDDTAAAVALADRKQSIPNFKEISATLNSYRATFVHEPGRFSLAAPAPPERKPPTDIEKATVRGLVQGLLAELEAKRQAEIPPPPLADVTMKGEALRRSRQARGIVAPIVADQDPSDASSAPDNSGDPEEC